MSTSPVPITIALIDDYPIVVQGLARMLEDDDRLDVVELDSMVDPGQDVDLLLYDSFAAKGRVRDDTARLLRNPRYGRVVVYTWDVGRGRIRDALDVGVHGYLSKALGGSALADALVRVQDGETVVEPVPPVEEKIPGDWPGRRQGLSGREAEVVALITQGLTNDQIAAGCFLSINSVKSYIRSAYRKMGVERRSQAVLWGIEHGMRPHVGRRLESVQSGPPRL